MKKFWVETNRLILRPFSPIDAGEYYTITRDESVQKYVPMACPISFTACLDDIKNVYSKGDFLHDYYVIIEEKDSGYVIGAIICVQIHDFDLSAFISNRYRRNGYMHEALKAFLSQMPKGSIISFAAQDSNAASINVLQSIEGIGEVVADSEPLDPNVRKFVCIL